MALKRQDIHDGGINYYIESVCPHCNKRFEHTKEWGYWRGNKQKRKYFCSWTCVRAFDASKPEKRSYRRTTSRNAAG